MAHSAEHNDLLSLRPQGATKTTLPGEEPAEAEEGTAAEAAEEATEEEEDTLPEGRRHRHFLATLTE